jgi:tetratricopeptide (TPR) repeat protein
MRFRIVHRLCGLGFALLVSTVPVVPLAQAQEPAAPDASPSAPVAAESRDERLDALFAELKRTSQQRDARRVVDQIWAEWNDSGSATVNLLMQWAQAAIEDERHGTALDLLDQVTTLVPDYAEGWNRRATLHYAMEDHAKSMADINRVLSLEPRHFGALAGMAAIMTEAGNDRLALRAYLRSLEVYPADRATQRQVGELEDKLSGNPI